VIFGFEIACGQLGGANVSEEATNTFFKAKVGNSTPCYVLSEYIKPLPKIQKFIKRVFPKSWLLAL
jgi:hypothetical protein